MSIADLPVASDLDELRSQKTLGQKTAELIRKQPLGAVGLLVVVLMVVMAVFANYLTGFDPEENDFAEMLMAPGFAHLLGTDQFGRDILTRLIYGARTALFVGFTASFVGSSTQSRRRSTVSGRIIKEPQVHNHTHTHTHRSMSCMHT